MESIKKSLKAKEKKFLPNGEEATLIIDDRLYQNAWAIIPNQLLESKKILPNAKLLWAVLYAHGSTTGTIFPGQERLGKILDISSRQIRTLLANLEEENWVIVNRRGLGKTNTYVLVFPEGIKNPKTEAAKRKQREKDERANNWRKRFESK